MKKLTRQDIEQNSKIYTKYSHSYLMEDGWASGNKQQNFSLMLKLLEMTGIPLHWTTCLDVGCGTGDLSFVLRQRGVKKYLGVEVYAPSFSRAKEKYPQEHFVLADFLVYRLRGLYDYAFCSGSLTVKLIDEDNYDYLEAVVRKMWNHTRIGMVFNVLTDEDEIIDHDLFFFSPKKVNQICRKIVGDAEIRIERTVNVAQIHVYLYRLGIFQVF